MRKKLKLFNFESLILNFGMFFNRRLKTPKNHGLRTANRGLNQRGWTLTELMLVTAMIGIITPAITTLFMKASQGFAADEMHNHLEKLNEQTLVRLHLKLEANKHMFQKTPDGAGVSFLNLLQLAPASNAPPTVLGNSQLPVSQSGTTITFSPPKGAQTAQFGNELLFAAYDGPAVVGKPFNASPVSYVAPISVFGPTVNYGASNGGGPATVILDVYRFYYYYLTGSTHPLSDAPSYGLVEWRSIQYVDFNQLNSFAGDNTLITNVVNWLTASGPAKFPGGPITWAYDTSQVIPYDSSGPYYAFYQLNAGGWTAIQAPIIYQGDWTYLTQASSGILSTGFRYGVGGNAPNYGGVAPAVPLYAAANAPYPGGFEVGIIGSSAGEQILTRCLLVAKGASPRVVWNDTSMVNNAKDVW